MRDLHHSRRWLAIYVIFVAMAFSFIFFEVLDIDGSELQARPPTAAARFNQVDPPHEIRRAFLQGPAHVWVNVSDPFVGRWGEAVRSQDTVVFRASPLGSLHARGYRMTLPRASLEGPPASV